MREISEIIYAILSTDPALIAAVGNKVFPLIADQNVKEPFVTFNISEEAAYSKESKLQYTVTVSSYDKEYNDAIDLAELVKTALLVNATEVFNYEGGQPYLNDENQLSVVQSYKIMN